MRSKTKPKYNMMQNVSFMARMAWKTRKSVLIFCIGIAATNMGIKLLQLFIAPGIIAQVEQFAPFWELIGTIAVFSVGLFILQFIGNCMNTFVPHGRCEVRASIREMVIQKMCMTAYPNASNPQIMNMRKNALASTNQVDCAAERIWPDITAILMNIGVLVVQLMILTKLNLLVAIIIVVVTIIATFVAKYNREWEYRHREEKGKKLNQFEYVRDQAESSVLAKDIRILGLKQWIDKMYERVVNAYDAYVIRKERAALLGNIADVVAITLKTGIAYVYLIHMALTQGLSAAEFLLYFNTIAGFSTHINDLLVSVIDLYRDCLEIAIVQEYLAIPEPFCFEGGKPIPKSEKNEISLENVSFRYPGSDKYIFHQLNLTIHAGENMAIVGLNGAGKTTLVKLLCGFYDPDEGRVLFNGMDIRNFNRREYYRLFSAVFQDYSLLDVTIAESVAQQHSGIDMTRVAECIKKAGLEKQISQLPLGLETHIGKEVYSDGILLSGGQVQRLLLARALYKNGEFLVLDEPTAALDPIAEDDIYRKYNEMTQGKTSIFISHRLASTRFCDTIILLADGKIAEKGTHEELLRINGEYAKLYEVQSHYYQGEMNDNETI